MAKQRLHWRAIWPFEGGGAAVVVVVVVVVGDGQFRRFTSTSGRHNKHTQSVSQSIGSRERESHRQLHENGRLK